MEDALEYPRRPGSDDSGRDYEIKITSLLALRCAGMGDAQNLWLGSNVDHVGDFDDIVLCKQTADGKLVAYMVQLKHQENPKDIHPQDFTYPAKKEGGKRKKDKENFSLAKYSQGFADLMENLRKVEELEVLRLLRKTEIVFVLYTNKGVSKCDYLESVRDDGLGFLNTSGSQNVVYSFDHNKLEKYDPEFLQKLLLFTEQAHVSSVDDLIIEEIKKLVGSSLANVDFKAVVQKFLTFAKGWIKGVEVGDGKDNSRVFYSLSKRDIICELTDIMLDPYKCNFSQEPYTSYDVPQKNIWTEIVRDKTITIIDSDETVVRFLRQFIGDELKAFCGKPGRTWGENLPKKAQISFFNEHEDLKPQIWKFIGADKLSLLDIYKCLWFDQKLPLLLQIEDAKGYQDIVKIIKVSNFSFRVVVVTARSSAELKLRNNPKHFASLKDLSAEQKEKVLNQNIRLQGRSPVPLREFADKSVYQHIKCKDVIYILSGDYVIGYQYEPLNKYFIERSLYKVFLKLEVLNDVSDEVFLIENLDKASNLTKNPNIMIVTKKERLRKLKELKSAEKTFHRVLFCGDCLEWKETFGKTKNIQGYQVFKEQWTTFDDLLKPETKDNLINSTRVLSAGPGMGKSTIMDFIALAAPGNVWVLKIELNNYREYFEKQRMVDVCDYLEYFNERLLEKLKCPNKELGKAIFEKLLNERKLLVLLDGFDEISLSCKDQVTSTAKSLHQNGYAVWLTTRPVTKDHLENRFDAIATTLKPFTAENQKSFLIKYFTDVASPSSENHQTIIEEFVEKLLRAASANLTDKWCVFTGVPLQTKLLADVFSADLKLSLDTETINFKQKFDLLYLYQEFIKRKIDILCGKYGEHAKEMRVFYEKHQKLFALKAIFDQKDLAELDIEKQLKEFFEDERKINLLQKDGVAVVDHKLQVDFTHRTFAEFLSAEYLTENVDSQDDKVRNTIRHLVKARFRKNYKFLFSVFDVMLAQDSPLHMAVLNGEMEEAEKIVKTSPESTSEVDKGGRTTLHVITFADDLANVDPVDFAQDNLSDSFKKLLLLIEQVPDNSLNAKDKLGYTPLDYAVDNWSPIVANKICERLHDPVITIKTYITQKLLTNCGTFKCRSIFRTLLSHICFSRLLLGELDRQETIKLFCTPQYFAPQTITTVKMLNTFIKELEVKTVLELFTFKGKQIDSPHPDYYSDLRFAAAFGTEDNVSYLLSKGAQINEYDTEVFTPLLYATFHNRLEIVKLLARKGAQVNKPNKDGNTPLHIALLKGHIEVAKFLVSRGANENLANSLGNSALHVAAEKGICDLVSRFISNYAVIDKQNNDGDTALHLALFHGQTDVARLLLENDANFDVVNNEGSSPIHTAAFKGNDEILQELLNRGANINSQNEAGDTPLHLALFGHRAGSAKFLLANGAENMANKDGSCPIHLATFTGYTDILLECLARGADVNSQNKAGDTPLHLAALKYNLGTLKLLLGKGANVNGQNMCGQTPLHIATFHINKFFPGRTKYEKTDIKPTAQLLLQEGADVNVQDLNGNTALHCLCMRRISTQSFKRFLADMVTLFLGSGADPNIKNNQEETVVDLAIRSKVCPEIVKLLTDNGARKSPEEEILKFPSRPFRVLSTHSESGFVLTYDSGSGVQDIRMEIGVLSREVGCTPGRLEAPRP